MFSGPDEAKPDPIRQVPENSAQLPEQVTENLGQFPKRESNRARNKPSKSLTALTNYLQETLPPDFLLDSVRIFKSGKGSAGLTIAMVKLVMPDGREAELDKWREGIETKWNVSLIVEPEKVASSVTRQLQSIADSDGLVRDKNKIMRLISRIHGERPQEAESDIPLAPLSTTKDLRHIPFISIDPENALELDDVLWIEPKEGGGWKLYVAFTDVTWRVAKGSAIDSYAAGAGFSIMGREMVVPILGHGIAHKDLSLLMDQDRIAWTVFLDVEKNGQVSAAEFSRAVVRNRRQFSYEEVEKIEQGTADPQAPLIRMLSEVASALRSQRLPGVSLAQVNEQGENRVIVQEAMIASRVALAELFELNNFPAIYRVHSEPSEKRCQDLIEAINKVGIPAKPEDLTDNRRFTALLLALKDKDQHELFNDVVTTFQGRARYGVNNLGHAALGVPAYLEIKGLRTYAGLINQRQLASLIEQSQGHTLDELKQHERQLNRKERVLDDNTARLIKYESIYCGLQAQGEPLQATVRRNEQEVSVVIIPSLGIEARLLSNNYKNVRPKPKIGTNLAVLIEGYDPERRMFAARIKSSE